MSLLSLIPYELSSWQWAAVIISAICLGISKTGLSGIVIIAVPLMALIFGGKSSTGIIVPLFCFGDLFAVLICRRNAVWKYIWRLVPWAIAGFALALVVDRFIESDRGFKILIGICILAGLVVPIWTDLILPRRKKRKTNGNNTLLSTVESTAEKRWYSSFFGIFGGFSTMIGNTGGPVLSIFLLSVKLPKEAFVGTAAWFFLIINYLKLPLQILAWHNITVKTLTLDLFLIPFLILGVWLGTVFVKKVSNAQYRVAVYALTIAAAIMLLL